MGNGNTKEVKVATVRSRRELNIAVSDISRRCLEGLVEKMERTGGMARSRVCRMACEPS